MNVAAKERRSKERWPMDFCPAKDCLWRVNKGGEYVPCPKHAAKAEEVANA